MARQVDPSEWERDIARIDRRLAGRRATERRRRDRIGRWIERGALLVLVVLYIVGFVRTDNQNDQVKGLATNNAELATAIVKASRVGCEYNNDVRENQWFGLQESRTQTEASLRKPGGLGPLEDFRPQIEANAERQRLRQETLIVTRYPVPGKPWRVDCVMAYP